jgi:protein-tyrosine-phosphatase
VNSPEPGPALLEPEQEYRPGSIVLFVTLVRYAAARARQGVIYSIARVINSRLRRDPARLVRALREARQVLIVCHGNIIRSAFAARLMQQMFGPIGRVRFASAGVEATPGRPPHPIALRIAARHRVDLSRHAASRVSAENVRASDVVFAVDVPQFVALRRRFPEAKDKIFLLTSLAPRTPLEIADPIFGDDHAFEACFAHITQALDPIGRVIAEPLRAVSGAS